MGTAGWTPVDEAPKGWKPVAEATTSAQPAPTQPDSSRPQTPGTASMSAREPSYWDRWRNERPFIGRIEEGVKSGLASLGGGVSGREALAKPSPAMETTQAITPEQGMTPSERQQHPIKTAAGEFAGGISTPENILTTMMTGGGSSGFPLPGALNRALGGGFAALMLKGAYDQLPTLQDAVKRKDWNEVEHTGTHVVLGGLMGALGARQAASGVNAYEQFRQNGKTFYRIINLSETRRAIETNGVGLYNRVRDAVTTHQEALKQQGSQAIQQAIEADNASQTIKGRGNISTTDAVNAMSDALARGGYNMKPAERTAFNALAGKSELTLQEAKLLRTQFGRMAFERSGSPEFKAAATGAYDQLGEAMRGRVDEIYGTDKPYHLYNNRFKMAFELNKGVAGDMMDSLQGQDANASIDPLKKFSKGNLKEITKQMRDTGNDQLATQLEKSQKDAKALTAAHDTMSGKFFQGAIRMMMQHPRESWPGLIAMAAVHGIAPFPWPQLAGAGVAAANMMLGGMRSAGEIGDRLQGEIPSEKFQTRTQAMPGETFTPRNPDEGWTPPKGPPPSNAPPTAGEPETERIRRRGPEEETPRQRKVADIQAARRNWKPSGDPDAPASEIMKRAKVGFEEQESRRGDDPEARKEKRAKIAALKGVK